MCVCNLTVGVIVVTFFYPISLQDHLCPERSFAQVSAISKMCEAPVIPSPPVLHTPHREGDKNAFRLFSGDIVSASYVSFLSAHMIADYCFCEFVFPQGSFIFLIPQKVCEVVISTFISKMAGGLMNVCDLQDLVCSLRRHCIVIFIVCVFPQVQCYDPESDTWLLRANIPIAKRCITAVSLNNLIYVSGGLTKSIYCYDPTEDYWMHVVHTFSKQVLDVMKLKD